jgi:ABC-2 type transport system permease protein
MRAFLSLAMAITKGFFRDRTSVFFAVVFPLMFLLLFGGIFEFESSPRIDLVQVGDVPVLDDLPEEPREAFEATFEVTRSTDRPAAIEAVRQGDSDVAVEMAGDTLVAHYTRTDQVKAGITAGTLSAFVDGVNVTVSGVPPRYDFDARAVEDESLQTIQYVTPGLLGWAVAMSAAFGAAATLQGWRQSGLMRRLRLAPVSIRSIVAARVVVTIGIALLQMGVFLGLAHAAFGLRLSASWWLAIPLLVCGTLSFMALGLLAGALARTAEGAVNLANFLVLPMAFLSGSFFPLDGAPTWLHAVSRALPLRHLNEGMLDVLVRGQGLGAALPAMLILVAFAAAVGLAAVRLFRWETD